MIFGCNARRIGLPECRSRLGMYPCARDIVPADCAIGKPGDARAAASHPPLSSPPCSYVCSTKLGPWPTSSRRLAVHPVTADSPSLTSRSPVPSNVRRCALVLTTRAPSRQRVFVNSLTLQTVINSHIHTTRSKPLRRAALKLNRHLCAGAGCLVPGCVGLQARSAEVCRRRRLRTAEANVTRHARAG
jgi:hypothetical protein